MVRRQGDRTNCSIPQPDGSTHVHEPGLRHHKGTCTDEKCDHDVTCSSPSCNAFFEGEWQRWQQSYRTDLVPTPPVASPTEEQRPKTVRQLDEEQAALEERARENAAIERAVRRQNVERFQPTVR